MILKRWFILFEEKVHGPFSASEVLEQVTEGRWANSSFWAKGKPSWMSFGQAQKELEKERAGLTDPQAPEISWYTKINGIENGPYTYDALLQFLKTIEINKDVLVCQGEVRKWKEVYQVESILERLGINRRAYDRVPIEGEIHFQSGPLSGKTFSLTTISQNGFGSSGIKELSIGEKFKGTLRSKNFAMPLHFQGEVVFINAHGILGVKFNNLSTEAQTHIIAYVRRFVLAHPGVDFKKTA